MNQALLQLMTNKQFESETTTSGQQKKKTVPKKKK
jgi:hypothetical protein